MFHTVLIENGSALWLSDYQKQKEGSLYRAAFPVFAVLKRNISIRLLWSG
ncbi:hypothetical protein [Anaerocolumna jejuensis]|nr:hypothetical protein [Anaerocolumna jejuensis]